MRQRGISRFVLIALVAYLLGAVLLVSVHQHEAGPLKHECALCVAAQTSADIPRSTFHLLPPQDSFTALTARISKISESEARTTCPSRAPPEKA